MRILYVLSVIALFISYLLVKKSEKKIDILKQIALNLVILFCYNAFVYYVTTFFRIPLTLWGFSGINLFFSLIMIIYMIKTKKVQKYSFKVIDLIYIVLLGIAVLIVTYFNFNFPFEIKYESGDPSAHYITSEKFAEEDSLLPGGEADEVYGKLENRKTASYVNSGLIMKCLQGIIDPFYNYVVFIAFGIFILFLSGWMFYSVISRFAKNNITRFLAFAMALLYTMGYPLNSLLFGFEYLSMGILVLSAIIASIDIYQNEEIGFKQNLLVFFLLNYGLFTAYFMFVPYVYSGLWIYFCINHYRKTKKICSIKLCILLSVTLLLPFIFGYIYHITPQIYGVLINKNIDMGAAIQQQKSMSGSQFKAFGYVYVNLFSNEILLLPFAIVAMYKCWKENRGQSLITLLTMAFIFLLLIGYLFEKVSMYYLNKNYYALWVLLYYLSYKGLLIVYEKNKVMPFAFIGIYALAIIITLTFFDTNISHGKIDKNENILQVADIYGANKTILQSPKDLTREELELIKYVEDNIPKEAKLEVAGSFEQVFWEYALIRRINKDLDIGGQNLLEAKAFCVVLNAKKADYVLYFNRGEYYKKWKNTLQKDAKIIYENEAGGILTYNQ